MLNTRSFAKSHTVESAYRVANHLQPTMATIGVDDDEYKSLEQITSRVAQLTSSIERLLQDVHRSNPLPPA